MGLGKRPITQSKRPQYNNSGPPAWLVFVLGIAVVFGIYYLWSGVRDYVSTGGLSEEGATARALVDEPTAEQRTQQADFDNFGFTAMPTATEIPACINFEVAVPSAIVRAEASTNAAILDSLSQGEIVCVISLEADGAWYLIDRNPRTRRIETGYMSETIIEAVDPTPTPTRTLTPAPTVTDVPTFTPSQTAAPQPTPTRDPGVSDTPTPTPSLTPTAPIQSA
ncbi:MAG: SH3 domain-containing protein [Chitinophagaceae bacterium]|nr:SH3 domain-containing protein [Anaerolineae bacterium]